MVGKKKRCDIRKNVAQFWPGTQEFPRVTRILPMEKIPRGWPRGRDVSSWN